MDTSAGSCEAPSAGLSTSILELHQEHHRLSRQCQGPQIPSPRPGPLPTKGITIGAWQAGRQNISGIRCQASPRRQSRSAPRARHTPAMPRARSRIRFLALRLVLVLERVPDGLDPDQPVSKHERVDPVVHASALRVCRPLEQQYVLLVDLGREVPLGLRDVGQELRESLPDPVRAPENSLQGDETATRLATNSPWTPEPPPCSRP